MWLRRAQTKSDAVTMYIPSCYIKMFQFTVKNYSVGVFPTSHVHSLYLLNLYLYLSILNIMNFKCTVFSKRN